MNAFRAQPKSRFWRIPAILVLLGVVGGGGGADAQSPESRSREAVVFEVVSIKPVAPGRVPLAMAASCSFQAGRRFRCAGSTLQGLISMAFRFGDIAVPRSHIVGGPDWIATSQFEITALLNTAVQQSNFSTRLPALLRPVLEDRFTLDTHIERRFLPVYALVRAFNDGRLGPRLRESTTTCPPFPSGTTFTRPPTAGEPKEQPCWGGSFRTGDIRSGRITMAALATMLTNQGFTDRIVLDRTDLMGNFEVDLRWSSTPQAAVERPGAASPELLDLPSLFAAVEEQLGLKLEPRTELMDVLVIDHVQLPTPN